MLRVARYPEQPPARRSNGHHRRLNPNRPRRGARSGRPRRGEHFGTSRYIPIRQRVQRCAPGQQRVEPARPPARRAPRPRPANRRTPWPWPGCKARRPVRHPSRSARSARREQRRMARINARHDRCAATQLVGPGQQARRSQFFQRHRPAACAQAPASSAVGRVASGAKVTATSSASIAASRLPRRSSSTPRAVAPTGSSGSARTAASSRANSASAVPAANAASARCSPRFEPARYPG